MSVEPSSTSTSSASGARTILLAEDDDTIRALVYTTLEQAGFVVFAASDGRTAAELFEANPGQFSLVLTDVIMPHATGTELAVRVRKLRPDVPILFMSAFPGGAGLAPDPLPVDEALLEKPFTMTTLLETICRTLGDTLT